MQREHRVQCGFLEAGQTDWRADRTRAEVACKKSERIACSSKVSTRRAVAIAVTVQDDESREHRENDPALAVAKTELILGSAVQPS